MQLFDRAALGLFAAAVIADDRCATQQDSLQCEGHPHNDHAWSNVMRRTDETWLNELQGHLGNERLDAAHQDLGRYLYTVAYHHLLLKQTSYPLLDHLDSYELAELAADFVQQTLEKLVADQFALLQTYRGQGSFTSWAAVIIINEVRQELRRAYWRRSVPFEQPRASDDGDERTGEQAVHPSFVASGNSDPEAITLHTMTMQEIERHLQECINSLNGARRTVFWEVECNERSVKDVAQDLGLTPNAISLRLLHARRSLRGCLEKKGITADVLPMFSQ